MTTTESTFIKRQIGDVKYVRTLLKKGSAHRLMDDESTIDVLDDMYAWAVLRWDYEYTSLKKNPRWEEKGVSTVESPPDKALVVMPDDVVKAEMKILEAHAEVVKEIVGVPEAPEEVAMAPLPKATLAHLSDGRRLSGDNIAFLVTGLCCGVAGSVMAGWLI
jgi:hypothetical protein